MSRILPTDQQFAPPSTRHRDPELGTLLWIGGRSSRFFRDAYQYSDSQVCQIAYRRDVLEALNRPAAVVNAIVSCHRNDSVAERKDFLTLRERLPQASPLLLLSPLCAGQRPHPSLLFDAPAVYWHEWEQSLPNHLVQCGLSRPAIQRPRSVAVVASNAANAKSLMTIADGRNISALWCRAQDVGRLQNIDEYWWDDSATQSGNWAERLSKCNSNCAEHVWLASLLTPIKKKLALQAGVRLVLPKPGDLSPLLERTGQESFVSQRVPADDASPRDDDAQLSRRAA